MIVGQRFYGYYFFSTRISGRSWRRARD